MKYVMGVLLIILVSFGIFIFLKKKNKKEVLKEEFAYKGAAASNVSLYKTQEERALRILLAQYSRFTEESLRRNIDDLTTRLINGQNNGYLSQNAFAKTATDQVLALFKNMKKLNTYVINYENNYMSVAVIFNDNNNYLYHLLIKFNVQDGLLYLDSYNATRWVNN